MKKNILVSALVAALVASLAGGSFALAKTLTKSKDIADGTVQNRDIKKGTVSLNRMTKGTQNLIRNSGSNGSNGAAGARGPAGANGAAGPAGPAGAKGDKGDAGPGGVTNVTAFAAGQWVKTEDDCGAGGGADTGAASIGANLAFGSFADGNARARTDYAPLAGKTVESIAKIEYSAKYEQTGTDATAGTPYFIIKTTSGSPAAEHSIVFTPNTQPAPDAPVEAGKWQRFLVQEGTVRYDDDAGSGSDIPWETLVRDHGDEVITRAGIQAGCGGAGSQDTTSAVDNVVLDIEGEESSFDFGT